MKKILVLAAAVTLTASVAMADEILDFSSFVRAVPDPTGTTVNARVIVPYFSYAKGDNGWPTKLTFHFNVWDPITNTQLFATTNKSVIFPASPCTNPSWSDHGMDPKFMGRWGGGREHVVIQLHAECNEQISGEWKEKNTVFVYSANVQQGGGSVWSKAYSGELLAANGLDLTDGTGTLGMQDGKNETLMISIQVAKGVQMWLLDASSGTLFSNPAVTMPSNKIFKVGNP